VDAATTTSTLSAALLAADTAERTRLLQTSEPTETARTIEELGRARTEAAGDVLALADAVLADKRLRKLARRELHRLGDARVRPAPVVSTPPTTAGQARPPEAQPVEAWATAIDGEGSRRLWLIGARTLGGVWLADFLLNDVRGVQEIQLIDTTRKRVQRELDELRRDSRWSWTQLPVDYALRLIGEDVELARAAGQTLPQRYTRYIELFGEPPPAAERALVFDTISPMEVRFHPDWLDESDRLVVEPELFGWDLTPSSDISSRALAAVRARYAALVVPTNTPEQQVQSILADAGRELITPEVRHALRRRLEETAYVLVAAGRLPEARRAAAAAVDLADAARAAHDQPFLRSLLVASIARSLPPEPVAGRSAAETFVELTVARGGEQDQGRPPLSTTSTGLILPR
jgi:hypothetical protein